jgi:hypothetical protein
MPKVATMADKYNLDITISLDYVPEEYDYNLILVDKFSRLLGVGKNNGSGGKSITIPNWCLKDDVYTLKVQTLDGSEVISEESYDLSFRENTLHMEFLRMQQALGMPGGMNFNYSLRKKLWEKQTKALDREVSVFQRNRYEEKYLEQMDAIYCDGQEFYA